MKPIYTHLYAQKAHLDLKDIFRNGGTQDLLQWYIIGYVFASTSAQLWTLQSIALTHIQGARSATFFTSRAFIEMAYWSFFFFTIGNITAMLKKLANKCNCVSFDI